jgi:hypothetical protein
VSKALTEDLDRMEELLRRGGFWLDDHYEAARRALRSGV